jgi:hypothetical protein
MTHTDAAQTATLHGIPAFADWARARGFREGDWVLAKDGRELLVHTLDSLGAEGTRPSYNRADCLLMPSESDLMDFLGSTHEYWSLEYLPDEYEGLCSSVLVGDGDIHQWSDTRIGALVAAVVAVGGE